MDLEPKWLLKERADILHALINTGWVTESAIEEEITATVLVYRSSNHPVVRGEYFFWRLFRHLRDTDQRLSYRTAIQMFQEDPLDYSLKAAQPGL